MEKERIITHELGGMYGKGSHMRPSQEQSSRKGWISVTSSYLRWVLYQVCLPNVIQTILYEEIYIVEIGPYSHILFSSVK